jgi:hypothetical protein
MDYIAQSGIASFHFASQNDLHESRQVMRRIANPVLPASFPCRASRFALLQNPDDLFLRKSTLLHSEFSPGF